MKILLTTLLLWASLFTVSMAETNKTPSLMECEMIIEMYSFSIDQGNPVTKEQVVGGIEACNAHEKHQKTVENMKNLLESL